MEDLNEKSEEKEQVKKNEQKKRREEAVMPDSVWLCGCVVVEGVPFRPRAVQVL